MADCLCKSRAKKSDASPTRDCDIKRQLACQRETSSAITDFFSQKNYADSIVDALAVQRKVEAFALLFLGHAQADRHVDQL